MVCGMGGLRVTVCTGLFPFPQPQWPHMVNLSLSGVECELGQVGRGYSGPPLLLRVPPGLGAEAVSPLYP